MATTTHAPPIRRVAVLGAGALGAFYASRFYEAAGFETVLAARGNRFARLREEGLIVNGRLFRIPVQHPDEEGPPADLILVALKDHHLAAALPDLQHFASENTIILSVMNGLDSEAALAALYGADKLLYTIAVGIDGVREGNRITVSNAGRLLFGELDNMAVSARVRRVQEALGRAGLAYETPRDMQRMLWWKFMINVGMNQASAVMRAPYGVFQKSTHAQALMEALMSEVITLAGAAGVALGSQDLQDWYGILRTLSPQGKTSMLQDIEAGRPTEVTIFGEKVMALGREHNIPTPVNETLVHIIRVLEERTPE